MNDAVIAQTRARRQLGRLLLPVAAAVLLAGALALFGPVSAVVRVLGGVVLAVGVLLALMAAGLHRQVAVAERRVAEAELDATILAEHPGCGESCTACATHDCAVKTLPRL